MSRTPGSDGPEDVDATFEEIVADLRAQGFGEPNGRGAERDPAPEPEPEPREPPAGGTGTLDPVDTGWRGSDSSWEDTMLGSPPPGADDDEHYVPPEPPPLPRPRKGAFVVLLFFVVGLLLLIAPRLIGLSTSVATPLGLLALATGIALLLLRVKQGPPDGADPDNGAQV
ncbi:hypothetical protein [Prauserella muralis]|uniref:Uncharacterized protein n=1 Tax=Prauserella muralis TaxID=588067 RepID=A0A2V4B1L2_9PSEU|nr:hypothetical protein [Prauserella muralis]PXY28046.1 hypothetical protein BAY60_17035 [Prauserella muralis]TWE22159.1 hypothetical protein FHX69_3393 [Prauserella muralis]